MPDINLKDLYPDTVIKIEAGIGYTDVILTKDHPDADRLIARWSNDGDLYFLFEDGKRSLSLDLSEAENILMAFVTAIFEPAETVDLMELGFLAARARDRQGRERGLL